LHLNLYPLIPHPLWRPALGSRDDLTIELYDLAESLGSNYDGWESPVTRASPAIQ